MGAKPLTRDRALALLRERPLSSDRELARDLGVSNGSVSRWRREAGVERPLPAGLQTAEVIARASEAGVRVTQRRLLRWLEVGLLPAWAGVRVHPGRGSATWWWPGIVDHAIEVDRLLRRRRNVRAALVCLVADGRDVDDDVATGAYRDAIRATIANGLLPSRSRRSIELRSRSLRGARLWLSFVRSERGLKALSAEARRNERLELSGRTYVNDVLSEQLDGASHILRGTLDSWYWRDDFVDGVTDPPPRELLDALHSRINRRALERVINASNVATLQEATVALGSLFLQTAGLILNQAEGEGYSLFGDLPHTRAWHALYREILLADPLVPAHFAPVFMSLVDSDLPEPVLASIHLEVALRYPDWPAMMLTLALWPTLNLGDWRLGL